jgi:hypothetical protein
MEFTKKGISILLEKDINESDDMFLDRGWFIVSQPKNSNIYEMIKYSKIWVNNKYLKCKYNKDLIKLIKEMEKNMYS